MKSDRRTFTIAIAVAAFLILSTSFRSYFLLGGRFLMGTATMDGIALGTTDDPNSIHNLGGWSVKAPDNAGQSRDEQLGQVLQTMASNWHREIESGRLAPAILEDYCAKNPSDLGARAQLLRLAINVTKLDQKFPQYKLLAPMCTRMAKLAEDGMHQEPDNWYWRERSFYYHSLLEEGDQAKKVFCQLPYPNSYDDRVMEDVTAREAWFRGQYFDLPESAMFPIWANTLFPHFISSRIIQEWIKLHPNDLEIRVAQVRFGLGMLRSSGNSISAFVSIRNIRQGLWNSKSSAVTPKPIPNKTEEARLKPVFLASGTDREWQKAKTVSVTDIAPFFSSYDPDYTSIQLGQYGPICVAAGIVATISGLIIGGILRRVKQTFDHPLWGWILLLIGLTIYGLTLNASRHLFNGSLGSPYALWLLVVLMFWNLFRLRKWEIDKKIYIAAILVIAGGIGCVSPYWQATSLIFLIAFVMQKGKLPLKPWTTAFVITSIAYHSLLNLAYANVGSFIAMAMVIMIFGIFLESRKELEPDQPRFATVSIGLGLLLAGIVLTSQYDHAVVASMNEELKRSQSIHDHLAKL